MRELSIEQRRALAQFLGSYSVAWLTVGLIGPYFSDQPYLVSKIVFSLVWAGVCIWAMLYLTQKGAK